MSKINHLEKLKNKKVMVTGGLGFVGQSLVKELLHTYNCHVMVVDDCSNSTPDALGDDLHKVDFKKVSVTDNDRFLPLIDEVNYIFHLACKQITVSGTEPFEHLKVNSESTLAILEYIRHNHPENLERFIYTSSCSVYGSTTHLPTSENQAKHILSNYAATKLLGEHFTQVYNRNYDIPVSVVRYSNVYGYGQTPKNPYCGVLGKFVHNALTGKSLGIFGDGEQTRDYTFITDAVEATLMAAAHPLALGDVFNIGTSVETSVNKLADLIKEHIPGINIEHLPERDIDNVRRRSIDIEKIHVKLGWAPKISIKRGIALTLDWYKTLV